MKGKLLDQGNKNGEYKDQSKRYQGEMRQSWLNLSTSPCYDEQGIERKERKEQGYTDNNALEVFTKNHDYKICSLI